MGREPDEDGFNDWVGQLNDGKSRLEVFSGFANSQEFYNICENYGITAGRYVFGYDRATINNVNLFVERLYKTCLGRIGDKDGQKNWVEKLIKKQISGSECARSFIFSAEYINKGLSDAEFVENLYIAMMGRPSDEGGKQNWLNALANGKTRDEVFAGFANSVEFAGICNTYKIDKGNYVATDIGKGNNNNNNNNATKIEGTYGDWAVTEAPSGAFWGGTWILGSQHAVDIGKADGVRAIIEYITLDDSKSGIQYAWANGTINVSDAIDITSIKPANGGSKGTIVLWSFTNEIPKMVYRYVQSHPDFDYNVSVYIRGTGDGYQDALDMALMNGQVDIYSADSSFVLKYTQGTMAEYAATYDSLGINSTVAVRNSDIASYVVDIGTRPEDNSLVALAYEGTGCAIIYRRSIAKDVWGTDDPAVVKKKIGGGTGSWDTFLYAAAELKAKGYYICSSNEDIWLSIENSADKGWVVNNKLYIDPKREMFFDISKTLYDNGYINNTTQWNEDWFDDMKGQGNKQVFAFLGPMWLVNYTLLPNCGNAPEWFFYEGDSVSSGKVMDMISSSNPFVGGQDMFDIYSKANKSAKGNNVTLYDDKIDNIYREQVRNYMLGYLTKEQAISNFKKSVYWNLGIDIE